MSVGKTTRDTPAYVFSTLKLLCVGELRDTHGELPVCSCLEEKKHRRRMLGMLERIFWENPTSAFQTQLVRCVSAGCRLPLTVKLLDCYMDWKNFAPSPN